MIEYRPMTEEDIPRVIEIENQCFSQPWSAEAMLRELRENAKMARYMVACADGRVVGYGGYWQIFDEAHITNIAVDGEHRRQGIAGSILLTLEAEYASRGILYATLEVRVSNTAAHELYLKHEFTDAGVRPGYYEKPREDAYIMWKTMETASGSR